MITKREPFSCVRSKFLEAQERFSPEKGNDVTLLKQCEKHLEALEMKREIKTYARDTFFVKNKGYYDLDGLFAEVLIFEEKLSVFFSKFVGDSFVVEEVTEVRRLLQDVIRGTPYEFRFRNVCRAVQRLECFV